MNQQLPDLAEALPRLIFEKSPGPSLSDSVNEIFRLGSSERNYISRDTWRSIWQLHESFDAEKEDFELSSISSMADQLVTHLTALSGFINDSMTRNEVFRFLEIGRRLERAIQISGMLKSFFIPLPNRAAAVFETALEVADSLMTYRSRYFANLQLAPVLDLLVVDESNPRSLGYQLVMLAEHVALLSGQNSPGLKTADQQRFAMALLHSVRMIQLGTVAQCHALDDYEPMENLINHWNRQLADLHTAISNRYFVHAKSQQQVTDYPIFNPE